ncbi:MAG TPA: hypothetical protein VM759_01350 [Longimicrobium sp.]|nr:hypothetical protein [Longimicrobium sp.]
MSTPADVAEDGNPPFDCRKCGSHFHGPKADDAGWCAVCRASLIRRSGQAATVFAAVVGAAFLWLLVWSGLMESPLMAFWLALGVVIVFVAYKVAHRVLFDVLRGRATGDGIR